MTKQKYPLPNLVSGKKNELVNSYKRQVLATKNKNFSKLKGRKRLMVYNVNCFSFSQGNIGGNANINISKLAKELMVDTLLISEYSDILGEPLDNRYTEQVYYKQYYNFGIAALSKDAIEFYEVLELDSNKNREVRGAIHIVQYGFNIILTHLDVWDETGKMRDMEIANLLSYISANNLTDVLLVGDFNEPSIDRELLGDYLVDELEDDYLKRTGKTKGIPNGVRKALEDYGFIDMFSSREVEHRPKFSCWTGKLVDFCYIYKPTIKNKIVNIDFYYTIHSDHLPLIIDIQVYN